MPPFANFTNPPNTSAYNSSVTFCEFQSPQYICTFPNPDEIKSNYSISTRSISKTIVSSTTGAVIFRAGSKIVLNPGFETTANAIFLATTDFGSVSLACETQNVTEYIFPGNYYNSGIVAQRKNNSKNTLPEFSTSQVDDLNLYPNPASELLFLKIDGLANQVSSLTIIDSQGKIYLQRSSLSPGVNQINIKNLPNGQYVAIILTNNVQKTFKFTVLKK